MIKQKRAIGKQEDELRKRRIRKERVERKLGVISITQRRRRTGSRAHADCPT